MNPSSRATYNGGTMIDPDCPVSFLIVGQTADGRPFRPSDWAERVCGVMSPYRPRRASGGHLFYSPYVMPGLRAGVKTVTVDKRLHEIEPLAWRFMLGFARDNGLRLESIGSDTPATTDKVVQADRAPACQ